MVTCEYKFWIENKLLYYFTVYLQFTYTVDDYEFLNFSVWFLECPNMSPKVLL